MAKLPSQLEIALIALTSIILTACGGSGGGGSDPVVNSAPAFDNSSASIEVAENTTGVIYTVEATDAEGNTITYSLSGDDQAQFSIGTSNGELQFKSSPAYDDPQDSDKDNVYEVQISASDSSSSSSMAVTVTVTEAGTGGGNSAPSFSSSSDYVNVPENSEGIIYTARATDADGNTITYSLSGGDDRFEFSIGASSGDLQFLTPPDYENPADDNRDNVYEVEISASDGIDSASMDLAIIITDDTDENNNNQIPFFPNSSDSVTTIENIESVIYTASATDSDGDTLTYSISGGDDGDEFTIRSRNGDISFVAPPDYENPSDSNRDNIYEVQISVSDSIDSANMILTVTVIDLIGEEEANQAPIANISVSPDPESTTLTTQIEITLDGSSSDDLDGDTLEYTWSQPSNQAIDLSSTNTATTTFTAADAGTYVFTLIVSDGELEDSSSVTLELIDRSDVPNQAPTARISVTPSPHNTILTTATEITLDGSSSSDPNGDTLTYTWSQPSNQYIDLSSSASTIAFTATTSGAYSFTLTVDDGEFQDRAESVMTIYPKTIPDDFTATAGDAEVALAWTPYSVNTIYSIYRSSDPDCDLNNYITACSAAKLFSNVDTGFVDSGLTNDTTYYYWIEAFLDNITQRSVAYVSAVPWQITPLNDTGIVWGGDYSSGNNTDCTSNVFASQDCHQGRDATHNDDSDGHAGFSFTKLDNNGNALAASATNWSCVQDNVTGLVWEVKTDDGSERDKDNTYRWGGLTAIGRDSSNREGDYYDDWNDLINYANVGSGLCGFSDWRVPSFEELHSIVDYSTYDHLIDDNFSIDVNYFPNTVSSHYWSASPLAHSSQYTGHVPFDGGTSGNSNISRSYNLHVRLVRVDQ